MNTNDQQDQRLKWRAPEIIEIGTAVDLTTWDPQYNLRDNQGLTPVYYKAGTVMRSEEVDLDDR